MNSYSNFAVFSSPASPAGSHQLPLTSYHWRWDESMIRSQKRSQKHLTSSVGLSFLRHTASLRTMMQVKLWSEVNKCTKKGIFCRTETVAMTPKSRDHMPTTSLWGVAAKWLTPAPKTKLILCPRDPQGYSRIRQDFDRVPEHRVSFEANPMRYSMGFAKSHSLKCSLHKWREAGCGAARKSARLNCINLIYFRLTAGLLRGSSRIVIPRSSANCYSSRQQSRPA